MRSRIWKKQKRETQVQITVPEREGKSIRIQKEVSTEGVESTDTDLDLNLEGTFSAMILMRMAMNR